MIARLIRMPSHPRAPLSSALAAVFVALAAGPAVAADFGHARVLSAAGAPLLVSVPVTNLTAQEVDTLRVGLADEASWQAAGLTPPAPLSTFRVALEPGVTPSSRVLRISSTQAPTGSAIDILLISTSPTGRRQVQFTVLAQPDAQGWHTPDLPLAAPESSSVDGAPVRARAPVVQQASGESVAPRAPRRAGTVVVRNGDTLSEIAMARRVSGASYYQMIVAMWRANPDAFIQGNMNLVKTGARLTVPDAATIRAENAEDAKRLYLQQLADFDVYRGRAARGAALAPAVGGAAASGRVEGTDGNGAAGANRAQDRLRLSAGDEAVSTTGSSGLGGAGAGAGAAAGAGGAAVGTGAGAAGSGGGAAGSSAANSGVAAAGANSAASGSGAMDGSTAAAPGNASPEDARAANARALAEQGGRVDALRRDVDALNRSAAGAGATPGVAGSSAEAGVAGAAVAGAGAGAAGAGAAGVGAADTEPAAGTSAAGSAGAPAGANTATAPSATGGPSSAADRAGGAAPSGTAGVAGPGISDGGAGGKGGAASQTGSASQSGSAGQPGTGGQAGAAGQSGSLPQPGIVGQSGASGQPGAAGQSGVSTQGGTTQGARNQGGTAQSGMATGSATPGGPAAGSPGTNNASSASPNASGAASGGAAGAAIGVPGAAAPEVLGGNANTAGTNDGDGASSLPAWLSDNLLVVITALLAIVAFIVAWMFRRAAARREDDDDGDSDGDEDDARRIAPSVAPVEIDPRLRKINLDLDEPPTDEPTPPRRRG